MSLQCAGAANALPRQRVGRGGRFGSVCGDVETMSLQGVVTFGNPFQDSGVVYLDADRMDGVQPLIRRVAIAQVNSTSLHGN
jgi:hypothetical protein